MYFEIGHLPASDLYWWVARTDHGELILRTRPEFTREQCERQMDVFRQEAAATEPPIPLPEGTQYVASDP